ncbi:mechanosensitive ion channel family protein [Polyangium jinanense]|uniref:mechanosensitive ion channel family protein n=1 Tax=Polyangium jinanense TaxID=2829994 RepID=UPI0023410E30|nr:mechanosensitive ion channel family protein [Polyangium jinanense]MDC3953278.1 mechanosensitive ion channel family protein [Polyangium jinanense]
MLDEPPIALFAAQPGVTPGWVIRNLPAWSYTKSVYGVTVWQWVALPLAFVLSMLTGALLSAIFVRLTSPIARRTATTWDDELLVALRGPATLFLGTTAFWSVEPAIALRRAASDVVGRGVDALLVASLLWGLFGLLDVLAHHVGARIAKAGDTKDRGGALSLVAISTKAAKVLLVIFGFILVLGQLGLNVTGIIAGLGIGGIAVALASQKTLENLFGSFTIGVDRPLHIGDFVRVDELVGTVEQIGLRSTRIRTLDRTLVTMPNGRLSDMRIENYSARDRLRLHAKIGLVYSTSPAVVRRIVEEMRSYLAERPGIYPDAVNVNFIGFGDSALTIEVMVWLDSCEWTEFLTWREEILFGLMEIVEKNGSAFAFPTQTIHVASYPSPPQPGPAEKRSER